MIYVRHRIDLHRNDGPPRVFEPLPADHPLVTDPMLCLGCNQYFRAGDRTVLVPLGPGDDPVAREKALAGNYFNAIALPLHAACAGIPEGG